MALVLQLMTLHGSQTHLPSAYHRGLCWVKKRDIDWQIFCLMVWFAAFSLVRLPSQCLFLLGHLLP